MFVIIVRRFCYPLENKKRTEKPPCVVLTLIKLAFYMLKTIPHSGIIEFVRIATSTIGNGVHNISFYPSATAGMPQQSIIVNGLRTCSFPLYSAKRILASTFFKKIPKKPSFFLAILRKPTFLLKSTLSFRISVEKSMQRQADLLKAADQM